MKFQNIDSTELKLFKNKKKLNPNKRLTGLNEYCLHEDKLTIKTQNK